MALVLVAVAFVAPVSAADASEDEVSSPSPEAVVAGIDDLGPKKAPVATARAIDRGYDARQIVDGLASLLLARDGTIATAGGKPMEPARSPVGVVAGDGEGGGPVTVKALRKGVAKSRLDVHRGLPRASRAEAEKVLVLVLVGLAAKGYSPEQIILDGLLADEPAGIDEDSDLGWVLRDKEKRVLDAHGAANAEAQAQIDQVSSALGADVTSSGGGSDTAGSGPTTYAITFTTSSGSSCESSSEATGTLEGRTFTLVDADGFAASFPVASNGSVSGSAGGITITAVVDPTKVKGTWSIGGSEPCRGSLSGTRTG